MSRNRLRVYPPKPQLTFSTLQSMHLVRPPTG